ncbi:tripartite tricarboxylate transporter substrate binding protein [Ramlibacter sp. AW1]|uniref:Tripartite tricarboxylate transporter substrate binding protein n=1 Tax=Ramlibacter aurantiacus TaxID=2801330 RepID=A0A936ZX14_9BURK|nr:tripartite tricarboxylate transporter substrate binding protein [Ramlibacter aurantiacus]MBL0422670.1 tripartite tricarboxylate transporter substrate binding protein [Ramlibacter aurantiacus]
MLRLIPTRRHVLGALGAWAIAPYAHAQAYPVRPIRIVCAHAPGGAADQLSRIVADRMAGLLGQPVVVENRPGASTMIAAEHVAAAPADGYTLLMATVTTLSINPTIQRKIRYSPLKDFAPVSIVASTPFFLGVGNDVPARTSAEVIALAKSMPGKLNYGSSGEGTSSHLAGELFNMMAGIQTVHVPYKATSARNNDLASGIIQMVFGNDVMALAKSGRVRVLGVTSSQRLSGYPEIPTVAEAANLPNYEASVWYGLVAPAGTPAPIVATIQQAVAAILGQPEVKKQIMSSVGGEAVGSTPEAFARTIQADLVKWEKVIRQANVRTES